MAGEARSAACCKAEGMEGTEGMAAQHRARSPRRALPAAPQLRQRRDLRPGRQAAQPRRPHRSSMQGALLPAPLLTALRLRRLQALPAFPQPRQQAP